MHTLYTVGEKFNESSVKSGVNEDDRSVTQWWVGNRSVSSTLSGGSERGRPTQWWNTKTNTGEQEGSKREGQGMCGMLNILTWKVGCYSKEYHPFLRHTSNILSFSPVVLIAPLKEAKEYVLIHINHFLEMWPLKGLSKPLLEVCFLSKL